MSIISVNDLCLWYGNTQALKNINIEIPEKSITALIGPSGCGKSTFLKTINRMNDLIPEVKITGSVKYNGEDIFGKSVDVNELRREIGMVFQKPTLFPWLTVEKNIAFPLKAQGKLKGNEDKVRHMLDVIGLQHFRNDYPGQLSGGMAQRVALVRTLISQPEILLLDEPLGALDAFTRMNMQDEILSMWREKKQLALMVTHDVDEAIYMGTRVIVMDANPGRIIADIKIKEDFPRDRSSEAFIAYRNMILNRLHFAGEK